MLTTRHTLALALVLAAGAARAADSAKVLISHQGRIIDGDSQPLAGQHTLKFTIHRYLAPPTAGTGLTDESFWTDSYDVTLENGTYAVVLGEGGKDNTPLTAAAFQDERFLAIALDGVPLSPRLRIGTAPFAVNAVNAQRAASAATADTAVTAQNVMRGATALFDDAGHFKGPADNLDVGRLGGKTADDFALVSHTHDDAYLKKTDAAATYATKEDLANVGDTLTSTYYTKSAADEAFAKKSDLTTLSEGVAAAGYLTKAEAAQTYAPKTGALPPGSMVLSESATDPGLTAAGLRVYGSLPSGWATKPNVPNATSHMDKGVEVNGKLYFIGGYIGGSGRGCSNNYGNINRTQIFDIASNSWSQGADMPTPRHSHATLAASGKIYAIAGYACNVHTAVNEIYDVASNSWSSGAGVPGGHSHHWGASAEIGGKFYLVAGCSAAGTCNTPQTHVYDPSNDTWGSRTPLPHASYGAAYTAINGKLYVTAGYDHGTGAFTKRTDVYDPQSDSWKRLADFPGTQTEHLPAVTLAGKLHLFGGHGGSGDPTQNHHWVYDPATDSWSRAEPLPWNAYGVTAVEVGTRAFLVGGWGSSGAVSNFAEYNAGLFIYRKN